MEKLYYQNRGTDNCWFLNNKNVFCVNTFTKGNGCTKKRADKLEKLFGHDSIIVFKELDREAVSSLSTRGGFLPYHYYSVVLKGLDHNKNMVKYKIIVGVSDYLGQTSYPEYEAFRLIQNLLMQEQIGVLKTDTRLHYEGGEGLWHDLH